MQLLKHPVGRRQRPLDSAVSADITPGGGIARPG